MISARSGFNEACKCNKLIRIDPFGVGNTGVSFRKEEEGLRAVWPLLGSTGVEIEEGRDGLGVKEWYREITSGSRAPMKLSGSWVGLGRAWDRKSKE